MPPIRNSPDGRRRSAKPYAWSLTALGLYILTFAAFAWPWLRQINDLIPTYPYAPDEQLIVWILSWVSHALADPNATVFDANIYHPAPAQLTGSDHLFFPQLLFTPLNLLTGQPLCATGIITFLTYPLAGLVMATLLVRLGCSHLVAWLCGLAYAVGILRVPLNFHVLQYPNLFLPLAALGAIHARRVPGLKSGFWLALIFLAALLTSFYIGVIVAVGLCFWSMGELLLSRSKILGFITTISLSLLAAVIVTALVLDPFIARSEHLVPQFMPWEHGNRYRVWVQIALSYWRVSNEPWRLAFAGLALLGLRGGGDPAWRRLALPGAVLGLLGTALVIVGLPDWLGQLAALTPLRNFRGWVRFLILTDFGVCMLAASGLDLCRRRFGNGVAIAPIAAFVLLTTLPGLMRLVSGMTPAPRALGERAEAYRSVRRVTEEVGRGPILELPAAPLIDCEAMLGSTFHWLPLLNGFSGYAPPHAHAMRAASRALPEDDALQELVDLSHLRWILMRPDDSGQSERLRQGLLQSDLIGRRFSFNGFTLLEVVATPVRPGWYPAIAAGPKPGTTALGTPIRRLAPAEAVASVERVDRSGDAADGGARLRVRNTGSGDWPVLVPGLVIPLGGKSAQFGALTVHLQVRWTLLPKEGGALEPKPELVQDVPLNRDLAAGDTLVQTLVLTKPSAPGRYRLDIRVVQANGAEFAEPPSRMLHEVVDLR